MESPDRQGATGELNGVALAAFVFGISSVSGFVGTTFFSSFAQDGWLFTISLIPAAAALLCAQYVHQQNQTAGAPARGTSFALAGAILAVVGAVTNTLNYVRIQSLDSPFG